MFTREMHPLAISCLLLDLIISWILLSRGPNVERLEDGHHHTGEGCYSEKGCCKYKKQAAAFN